MSNEYYMDMYTETLNEYTQEEIDRYEQAKDDDLLQKNKWRWNNV